MDQFITTLPAAIELPAIEVTIPYNLNRYPRVKRIAHCEREETRRLGNVTYQFPDLPAALRWVATYCGPWGCRVRNLLYDLRDSEDNQAA